MKQYFEIVDVMAREILDSRGNPTVEVESAERLSPPALPPVSTRPASCATATRPVTAARACRRQLTMSTAKSRKLSSA